jgi:restriction system protein
MAKHDQVPKYHELMNPLLKALHDLGGSGSIEEILSKVSDLLDLSEDILAIPHNPDKSSLTELEYRLAWGLAHT